MVLLDQKLVLTIQNRDLLFHRPLLDFISEIGGDDKCLGFMLS